MEPPDYHRCVDEVLRSPIACQAVIDTLAATIAPEVELGWSSSRGADQVFAAHGPDVAERIPAAVRLIMVEDALAAEQKSMLDLWRRLADVIGIPIGQYSFVELITAVETIRDRQDARIAELQARVETLEAAAETG